jgi:hypothetical protein
MKRQYAVIWSNDGDVESGRLDRLADAFELHGKRGPLSIAFGDVSGAAIRRDRGSRLRGLPVLALRLRAGALVSIASLEGVGALHELVEWIERGGVAT